MYSELFVRPGIARLASSRARKISGVNSQERCERTIVSGWTSSLGVNGRMNTKLPSHPGETDVFQP
jgi:hypothetical protein